MELIVSTIPFDKGVNALKYAVLNRGDELSVSLTETFHRLAEARGLVRDDEEPEIVLSIGGTVRCCKPFTATSTGLTIPPSSGFIRGILAFMRLEAG